MATNRSFNDMLQEYLPNKLLKEELVKRNWLLKNIERDDNWRGSKIIVPFKGARASSLSFGSLTDSADVAEADFVRGSIDDYRELWGTLKFNQRDLIDQEGKVPENTFLKVIEEELPDFMDLMDMHTSINLLTGSKLAVATADGTAGGVLVVDKIDRFELGQKVVLIDGNTAAANYYVIAINLNTSALTLSATRGGAAADISAYTVAQSAYLSQPGAIASSFTSLRGALLSAANGGDATLHGVSKLLYPYLQAINVDGSTITATNILDKIFDAFVAVQAKARGQGSRTVLMSFKHWGSVMKQIEVQKGAFNVVPGKTPVASEYAYMETMIGTPTKGMLTFVATQEMPDDLIFFIDPKSMTFRSKGFFRKRQAPDGKVYFESRATTGYVYLVDVLLFGELEVTKPSGNGVIYGISYA